MYISRVKGTSQTDSSSQVFQTALSLSSLWMDGWIHYRVLVLSVVWRVEDLWRQIDAPPTTDRQLIQTEEATKRLEHSKGNQLKICSPFLFFHFVSSEDSDVENDNRRPHQFLFIVLSRSGTLLEKTVRHVLVLVTSTVLLSNVHVCQHREDQAFGYFQVNLPVCGWECRLVEMSWGNERFSRGSHTFFRSVTFTLQQLYLEGKMDGHGIQPF